jgi:hypothetical protein
LGAMRSRRSKMARSIWRSPMPGAYANAPRPKI